MTTPGSLQPDPVDRQHILEIVFEVPGLEPLDEIGVFVLDDRFPARVYMPTQATAQAAEAALSRVGYDVRPHNIPGDRLLKVDGWNVERLEARLPAMHAVIESLSSDLGATATAALDRLSGLPMTLLPDEEAQQRIAMQARRELDTWINDECGSLAQLDPGAQPADPGSALLMRDNRITQDTVAAVADTHMEITRDALAAYPGLRRRASHDEARDTAVRQASNMRRARPVATVTALRREESGPQVGAAESPEARPWRQRGAEPTQIFRDGGTPADPTVSPPPASHPSNRNTPGGPRP